MLDPAVGNYLFFGLCFVVLILGLYALIWVAYYLKDRGTRKDASEPRTEKFISNGENKK